ncbi:hypothetical protein PFICI_13066 [Pestalotiopsis fici W106-1]|uniref:Vacuolar segregation protein 7 n=1 Tax=Pestalotiopsis fici (strain W106-1 / CGMCC3.15140) TaxID=1229662 RepID=W3WN39_PESFW|nr:uncharacterized protein PFICI_13066 [Pestalotiopsis fici W106-1]ETS74582.1 hypothetical protein PFICI_13066 [Pestalotiopsis fici W106-1]
MERSGTLPHDGSSGLENSTYSLNSVDQETSAPSSANVDTQPSRWTSATTSLTASPMASRESSPTRAFAKPPRPGRASASRSRKSSFNDPSPSRTRQNSNRGPTSAPRQQSISAATTPTLPPPSGSDAPRDSSQPRKPSSNTDRKSRDSPRWPVSPRLKSPPPQLNKPAFPPPPARNEREPPMINLQRATPSPHPHPLASEPASQVASDTEGDAAETPSGMLTPVGGPSGGSSQLETVQEVSQPGTPGADLNLALERLSQGQPLGSESAAHRAVKSGSNSESGSDSGSIRRGSKILGPAAGAAAAPPSLQTRQSSSALRFGGNKGLLADPSKHITVEEEEVSSGPRLALGLTTTNQVGNGSLKTKPSSETIRPRKEKRKPTRKAASVASGTGENPNLLATRPASQLRHSRSIRSLASSISCRSPVQPKHGQGSYGEDAVLSHPLSRKASRTPSITAHVTNLLTGGPRPASSKADIFEAKVASAVEEANSSDSDETFVYDSNPPDAPDRPRRYHSRTPSATSMVSQADRGGLRSIHSLLENGPVNPAIKKNMKFVNTYGSNTAESLTGDEDGRGTGSGRSNAGSTRAGGRHHNHANRWGRNNSSNHLSLFDNESPFPHAARSKLAGTHSRHSSNPPSPRFPQGRSGIQNSKRQMAMAGGYDLDDNATPMADDERTPLLHLNGNRSVRSNRGRRAGGMRPRGDLEAGGYHQGPSFLNRFASCLVLTIMLLLVIMGAVGFMFATSQPLTSIELVKIGNVLASEQELMLDITVRAHNPNIVVVSVDSADIEVFAKSPHAGTDSEWWRHPHDGMQILDDDGDDNESRPDEKSPNMRLGNIMELDSPLSFEGSFFQSGNSMSSSELRLTRPGNGTDGGSERWERILNDEFTLILKGVLKYTLPLSQKVKSIPISGKTTVKPNSASDPVVRKPNGTDFEVGIL